MYHYQISDHENGVVSVFLTIVGILFITTLVMIIIKLSKDKDDNRLESNQKPAQNKPIEIAKERYAKGEISKQEFEQLKNDLLE